MSRKFKRPAASLLIPAPATPANNAFNRSDVLYVLEWAAVAPGLGGWNVVLDNDECTREVAVIPPGSEQPTFYMVRVAGEVALRWLRPGTEEPVEVARFATLREAARTLCPLSDEQIELVNDAMEALYPRSLRTD